MNSLRLVSSTRSMLLGAALSATALLALGAFGGQTQGAQRISLDPHPALVVRIIEGQSYVVPPAKMLSVKALSQAGTYGAGDVSIALKINGRDVIVGRTTPNPVDLAIPIVAGPGDVVTVAEGFGFNDPQIFAVALGYLTDV
jgi:hypothetical protein